MAERIPIALIRKLCYPSGYRLPHLERLDYTWKNPAEQASSQTTRSGPVTIHVPRIVTVIKGSLPNDEYRFFIGKMEAVWLGSNCRWCDTFLHNADFRKQHKTRGCNLKLISLYKKLCERHACMACGGHTSREVWGVPLCSVSCDNYWRVSNPLPFVRALAAEKSLLEKVL